MIPSHLLHSQIPKGSSSIAKDDKTCAKSHVFKINSVMVASISEWVSGLSRGLELKSVLGNHYILSSPFLLQKMAILIFACGLKHCRVLTSPRPLFFTGGFTCNIQLQSIPQFVLIASVCLHLCSIQWNTLIIHYVSGCNLFFWHTVFMQCVPLYLLLFLQWCV